jgi:hypothetical protein
VTASPGTLRFTVKCTAKEALWIPNIETAMYEGEKSAQLGTKNLISEGEKLQIPANQSAERTGTFDVRDVSKPWVVKARLTFGYPGSMNVENLAAEMEAEEKDQRDNPTKYHVELSAAFE